MSSALPGQHYCLEHQGNHSHYDKRNCSLCMAIAALREATDVLEVLRRGHGIEVGAACYPALNKCRDTLELLQRSKT